MTDKNQVEDNELDNFDQLEGAENDEEESSDIEIPDQDKPKESSPEEDEDEGEFVVSIDGVTPDPEEEEAQAAPEWVRELRRSHREQAKRIRILEGQLNQQPKTDETQALGPKPTLESCDYDTDDYEQKLQSWYDQKKAVESAQAEKENAQKAAKQEWETRLATHETRKESLKKKVPDYDEAETVVDTLFNQTQQGVIVSGADDSALLFYALGKNPSMAKELAAIKDPVKFVFAVAKLETRLKMSTRKAPPPEKTVQSSGGVPVSGGGADETLARLRTEAEKTGDYTKVIEYRRELRRKKDQA